MGLLYYSLYYCIYFKLSIRKHFIIINVIKFEILSETDHFLGGINEQIGPYHTEIKTLNNTNWNCIQNWSHPQKFQDR